MLRLDLAASSQLNLHRGSPWESRAWSWQEILRDATLRRVSPGSPRPARRFPSNPVPLSNLPSLDPIHGWPGPPLEAEEEQPAFFEPPLRRLPGGESGLPPERLAGPFRSWTGLSLSCAKSAFFAPIGSKQLLPRGRCREIGFAWFYFTKGFMLCRWSS